MQSAILKILTGSSIQIGRTSLIDQASPIILDNNKLLIVIRMK
jgi:hypothetical protein